MRKQIKGVYVTLGNADTFEDHIYEGIFRMEYRRTKPEGRDDYVTEVYRQLFMGTKV